MSSNVITSKYPFHSAEASHTATYLTSHVLEICQRLSAKRVLDLGCGNGALCGVLSQAGLEVVGCDLSEEGVEIARQTYPEVTFHRLGVYDDPSSLGLSSFDVVISTEVIEHLFLPRYLPQFAAQVLRSQGHLILSTPYHGYLKNLLLALSGKMDSHFTALWDGGHIKFWSRPTLSQMLKEEGFAEPEFIGAGRLPYLWKSMILVAQKV